MMRNPILATRRIGLVAICLLSAVSLKAQYGPVGFATCNDMGQWGVTGGMGGKVVRVSTREALDSFASAREPYIIIIERSLKGKGLNREHDVVKVSSDKTIVGTYGAQLEGIGLDIRNQQNIIIRNLTIHHGSTDGIAARNSHHLWIDHCEVYSQDEPKREDWDGLIDCTSGSSYITVSYCYLHDHHKACLLNSGTGHFEDHGRERATYHHNAFERLDQRCPRVGYGLAHIFSNYYNDIGSYAIGVHSRANMLSESNYFTATVKRPFLQMYAETTDDASCAFFADNGSHIERPLREGFKHHPTGTDFRPQEWYTYDFACQPLNGSPQPMTGKGDAPGPVKGLEYEPILWPGNGAIDVPTDVELRFSTIDNTEDAEILIGTSPSHLSNQKIKLLPATTYYWQVASKHFSPVYRFTTAETKATRPTPVDGEQNAWLRRAEKADQPTLPLTLNWHPANRAAAYKIYLATKADDLEKNLLTETKECMAYPQDLDYGMTYYWRVDVIDKDGNTTKGDVWRFAAPTREIKEGRTEAEQLTRNLYAYVERQDGKWFTASNDTVTVGEAGPGILVGTWTDKNGHYDIGISYYDETSGQAWMGLYVNNRLVDEWTGQEKEGMTVHHTPHHIDLKKGDQLRIEFHTDKKMRCRIDCIDIKSVK